MDCGRGMETRCNMVDRSDAAYSYVTKANVAEERRALQREKPREPSILLNLGVALVLFSVALSHLSNGDDFYFLLFSMLVAFNLFTAFNVWRKRSNTKAGH